MSYFIAAMLCLGLAACNGPQKSGPGAKDSGEKVPSEIPSSEEPAGEAPSGVEAPSSIFPTVTVPSVFGDDEQLRTDYVLEHYWDSFLGREGATTPDAILGIGDGSVEQALANYIQILSNIKATSTPDDLKPLKKAQKSVQKFFDKIEAKQQADTSAHTYLRLTEMVSRYLYDPNSPLRDEDLYLPFVEAMSKSSFTREDMRNAYNYELKMCKTNPYGSKVPDIRYKDVNGHKGTLYAVKADYTMLFFSNPGCESCKGIIKDVMSRGNIEWLISDKKLSIVNIYIDEEVSKWREYSPNYPSCWINGYDYTFSLRDSGAFDIRAIPSLYLLDSSKRVIMKDAPTEKVLAFIDTL